MPSKHTNTHHSLRLAGRLLLLLCISPTTNQNRDMHNSEWLKTVEWVKYHLIVNTVSHLSNTTRKEIWPSSLRDRRMVKLRSQVTPYIEKLKKVIKPKLDHVLFYFMNHNNNHARTWCVDRTTYLLDRMTEINNHVPCDSRKYYITALSLKYFSAASCCRSRAA